MPEDPIYTEDITEQNAQDLVESAESRPQHIIVTGARPSQNLVEYLDRSQLKEDGEIIEQELSVYRSAQRSQQTAFQYRLKTTVEWGHQETTEQEQTTVGEYICVGAVSVQSTLHEKAEQMLEPDPDR